MSKIAWIIAACAWLTAQTAVQAAQESVPPAEGADAWVAIMASVILVLAVVALSFAGSKRTHQD